ncbi:Cathepsin O [Nymphon striatum]|nr:Cathepsin O [Nymphon striatum]
MVNSFDISQFEEENMPLINIATGTVALSEVSESLLTANESIHLIGNNNNEFLVPNHRYEHTVNDFLTLNSTSMISKDAFYSNVIFSSHNATLSRTKREILNEIPQKFDWRGKGVLTEIKDQKSCGACWAFSVVETVETMYALKSKSLVDLSVQQVIDCSADGNKCNGGDTCQTLKWLVDDRVKIELEKDYPTTLVNEACRAKHPPDGVTVRNFACHNFTSNEFEILKTIAYHGPVVAAVNSRSWHDYLGGIIQYHCDDKVDHAIQIVGYDLTGEVPFYIVRNSWGSSFGHDGYLYVKIGANVCGKF